jgi:hypothetical protein
MTDSFVLFKMNWQTKRLENMGLITQNRIFNWRPFELTDKGKIAVSVFLSEGAVEMEQVVRGHAFGFVCEILRKPKDLEERLENGGWGEFYPKNRVGYKKDLWGCTVVFNPRSVQFIPEEVYAPNGDAAFQEAYRLVLKIQDSLQSEYEGLVLGPITRIYNQQYARIYDPFAAELLRSSLKEGERLTYKSDRLAVDYSKGIPELETVHRTYSKDDMRKICEFYEGLVRTDFKIEDVNDLKEAAKSLTMAGMYLAENLKTHVEVLKEIKDAIIELRKMQKIDNS